MMNDLHVAYVAKRRKNITRTEATLKEIPGRFCMDRRVKDALAKDPREYKSSTFINRVGGPNASVHADGWDTCKQYEHCWSREHVCTILLPKGCLFEV